ncbi:MAG: hypothetical protein L0241_13880 [Planctomycetia bacterium]|nr:hypothetical protein [Planctomycetia bacterium]
METLPVEVYSSETNAAILRFPGRQFPGVLIQGDTLSTLFALSRRILHHTAENDTEEAQAYAEELAQTLAMLLKHYEHVLEQQKMPLPYVSPFKNGSG